MRIAFILTVALAGIAQAQGDFHPFFAYKNSMEDKIPSMSEQADLLSEIGFDGYDHRELEGLAEAVAALDARGLKLFTIYFKVDIDNPDQPWDPDLGEALPILKGHDTILWCNIHSQRFQPSDPAGDAVAVPLLQKLADLAAPYGVRVAPYPHIRFWVESPEDTARLAAQVNRPNFGTSFNLYHWKVLEGDRKRPIEEVAKLLAPTLMVISINGDEGKNIAIGPLEQADSQEYLAVIRAFRSEGYRGPVGLQCYDIQEDPRVHLRQSMAVWQAMKANLAGNQPLPAVAGSGR
ncbi:MAG: TIM barrel protein [Candidatus Hydrogenedentes bacterium]|nr:TIM barrel protein [Candidatus Hydrogenedentota bacterium]